MKISFNICKKHLYILIVLIAVVGFIGYVVAGSWVNPTTGVGHDPEEVGPGTFGGDSSDTHIFPGGVIVNGDLYAGGTGANKKVCTKDGVNCPAGSGGGMSVNHVSDSVACFSCRDHGNFICLDENSNYYDIHTLTRGSLPYVIITAYGDTQSEENHHVMGVFTLLDSDGNFLDRIWNPKWGDGKYNKDYFRHFEFPGSYRTSVIYWIDDFVNEGEQFKIKITGCGAHESISCVNAVVGTVFYDIFY
jgi:hypothetical protein